MNYHLIEKRLKELAQTDPEYWDEMLDPLRSAKSLIAWVFIAVLFWGGLCFLVAAVNACIGGG